MKNIIEKMLDTYERGGINRRNFVQSLATIIALPALSASPVQSGFQGKTINHVTLYVSDVAKSKVFYQKLLSLSVKNEEKDFCEFNLGKSFLGIYKADEEARNDHFCIGIESFKADKVFEKLKSDFPSANPTLEGGSQVYLRDPDNIRFQLSSIDYKV